MSDNKKSIQTQPEASPLQGNNASVNVNQDALGPQGSIITVTQTQTSGGTANTPKGI